jgi:hypothetical protein
MIPADVVKCSDGEVEIDKRLEGPYEYGDDDDE